MEVIEKKLFFLRGANVIASYKRAGIVKYRNSPLIEALPPILDMIKVIKKLSKSVRFNEHDRLKNDTLRMHCIYDLSRLVQPLENHLRIEQSLSILIRDGYVDRNPLTVNGVRLRNEGADNVTKAMKAYKNAEINSQTVSFDNMSYKTSGGGVTIIGVSGMGKTTAINNILMTMYPAQVIRHGQYKGHNINSTQIVWLKMECPAKGSIRSLCLHFFQILSELVGEDIYDSVVKNRATIDQMIPQMAQMCATYMVGSLFIDEIQHLSGNTENEEDMLNFFVTLKNMLGIPIILIGTNKAWAMLSKEFRQLRRACEHFGVIFWERMDFGPIENPDAIQVSDEPQVGVDWKLLMGTLWKYQWTRKPVELTAELNEAMYVHTQGVTDITVKLFMIAQWRAINSGDEMITPKIIREVAENELRALKPVLQALRLNEYEKLESFKDIYVNDFKIDKFFNQALVEMAKRSRTAVIAAVQEETKKEPIDLAYEAIKWLMEAQVPSNHAESIVRGLIEQNKNILLPELKNLALQMYAKVKLQVEKKLRSGPKKTKKEQSMKTPIDLTGDILAIGGV